MTRMIELQDKSNSIWLDQAILLFGTMTIMCALYGIIFFLKSKEDKSKRKSKWSDEIVSWLPMLIVTLLFGAGTLNTTNIAKDTKNELATVQAEYFDSLEEYLVEEEVEQVAHKVTVKNNLCPHKGELENCLFVKYLKDGEIKQVFIASETAEIDSLVKVKYYDLPENELESLTEFLDLENPRVSRDLNVDLHNWSVGYAVE